MRPLYRKLFKLSRVYLKPLLTPFVALWHLILTSPISTAAAVLVVISTLVVGTSIYWGVYSDPNFQINLISELHGVVFDILILGILMLWLNKMGEKRLETTKYLEEIDDFRRLDSPESRQRIVGHIKRLNKRGIYEIDLRFCRLSGADLQEINLRGSNMSDINLTEAKMQGADLSTAVLVASDISSANLMGASLQGANLSSSRLQHTNLWEANLLRANFEGADLSHANLESASCAEADFSGADFSGANLSGANFLGAVMEETILIGAMLVGANLGAADLSNAVLEHAEIMSVDLSNANCSRADLSGADFSNSNLCGVNFHGANFMGAKLTNTNLSSAKLVGAVNLTIEQFEDVLSLDRATLDTELAEQIRQHYPHLMGSAWNLTPQSPVV